MANINRLKREGLKEIPFQHFVEMYNGNAQFEQIGENRYRIVSFNDDPSQDMAFHRPSIKR